MSRLMMRAMIATGIALALSGASYAGPSGEGSDEQVENPEYVGWAKYKVGTTAVWKTVTSDGGTTKETTTTKKLIELTDNKAVIEQTTTSKKGDGATKTKTVIVPRLVSETKAKQFVAPSGMKEDGTESIELAGKTFNARWVTAQRAGEGGESTTRVWVSDSAPGGLLKKETKVGESGKTTTMELVELKSPKKKKKSEEDASAAEAKWLTDYDKAVKQAKKEDKMLMLDFTGSDWCGWCIKLDKEVFSKPEFKDWAGKKFVLVKVDFPRTIKLSAKVKKQNEKLQKRHGVQGYPTIVVLDKNEKPMARLGYERGGPDNWISIADQTIEESDGTKED